MSASIFPALVRPSFDEIVHQNSIHDMIRRSSLNQTAPASLLEADNVPILVLHEDSANLVKYKQMHVVVVVAGSRLGFLFGYNNCSSVDAASKIDSVKSETGHHINKTARCYGAAYADLLSQACN